MSEGDDRPSRNGVVRTIFGELSWQVNLQHGFPALTTKKLAWKSIRGELLFFLSGSSNVNDARRLGTKVWNANADAPYWKDKAKFEGDLGRIYGVQWRRWRGPEGEEVDQIVRLIDDIVAVKADPTNSAARRLIVSAWNPAEIHLMSLPACHAMFQYDVSPDGFLSIVMTQRSADFVLGVPFNMASYAMLTHMIASVTGLKPGKVTINFGNAHIYQEHFAAAEEQIARQPATLPQLWVNPEVKSIFDFKPEDIQLHDYNPLPPLSSPTEMAV